MTGRKGAGLPPNDPGHGLTGYDYYRCRCPRCVAAKANANSRGKSRRAAEGLPADDPRHGKASTYRNWGCRCESCSAAHATLCAAWRAKTAERLAAVTAERDAAEPSPGQPRPTNPQRPPGTSRPTTPRYGPTTRPAITALSEATMLYVVGSRA